MTRSGLLAKPFLVPVVIDSTTETSARVPDAFRKVQWTRLPGGQCTTAFVDGLLNLVAKNGTTPTAEGQAQRAASFCRRCAFISIEQARANLEAEIPAWDFEGVRTQLERIWNGKLGMLSIEGATDEQRRIFYTGLYHALLYPKLISEHGRYYSAFDDQVHEGVSYTAYFLWDTFRAEGRGHQQGLPRLRLSAGVRRRLQGRDDPAGGRYDARLARPPARCPL